MQLPRRSDVDATLIVGSLLFGVGWGPAGICPGPGLVLIGYGTSQGMVFVAVMWSAMALFGSIQKRSKRGALVRLDTRKRNDS